MAERVYRAAKEGKVHTLYALLRSNGYFLDFKVEGGVTPLMIAALEGRVNVVKMLLRRFSPDVEREGTMRFEGLAVKGATALFCAASAGHLKVVKRLISHGAEIDHATENKSTPLRVACYVGRLDVVRYLVDKGADVLTANRYDNDCLMVASHRGHSDLVDYLLCKKVDPSNVTTTGCTALHFAAESGHLDIVEKLLKSGARIKMKNELGLTPLMSAAERSRAEVVEYLIERKIKRGKSSSRRREALELLGASFANDPEFYSVGKAYHYMHRAMREVVVFEKKKKASGIEAYEYRTECQTLSELEAIKYDSDAIHMLGLVLRERILGLRNRRLSYPILYRGAVFADMGRYDRCLELWLRASKSRRDGRDISRFALIFAEMTSKNLEIPFDKLFPVLRAAAAKNVDRRTILYLLSIATKHLENFTPQERRLSFEAVYDINKSNPTLLHLAVNADATVDGEFRVCKFPCVATVDMLIRCGGADVEALDEAGDTPLHVAAAKVKLAILAMLLKAGCHSDRVNRRGKTPYEVAVSGGLAEIFLKSRRRRLDLKCLAARAVKRYDLPLEGLPSSLATFADWHGK